MQFDNETSIVFSERRLLRSQKGHLDLGPMSTEDRDEIWIIPGSNTPIIFRKASAVLYRLVGEAYVREITRGEALLKKFENWESIRIE